MATSVHLRRFASIVFVLSACSQDAGDQTLSLASTMDTVQAEVVAQIGLDETNAEAMFGDIRTIAVDGYGRTYVGDRIGSTVSVYDSAGALLAVLASEGEGPGELRWPADIVVDGTGALWVRDAYRITVFAPRQAGALPDSLVQTITIPGYGSLAHRRSGITSEGVYYYPAGTSPQDAYIRVRDGQFTSDSTFVPLIAENRRNSTAFIRTSAGGGRMVAGLNSPPFAPRPIYTLTDRGTVISSDGSSRQLVETSHLGDTLRLIGVDERLGRSVPSPEHADSAQALEARIDSLPVPLEDVTNVDPLILEGVIPERLPGAIAVHSANGGKIWVQRWHPEGRGHSRFYDVFSSDGSLLCIVQVPAPWLAEPPPYFGDRFVSGVAIEPSTDVEYAITLRIPDSAPCHSAQAP